MNKILKYKQFENIGSDDIFDEWDEAEEPVEEQFYLMKIILRDNVYRLDIIELYINRYTDEIIEFGIRSSWRYLFVVNKSELENNKISSNYRGVIYRKGQEEEAKKILKKTNSGRRGGLTRKINKRQEELEIFNQQRDSLDDIFN